jgi:protease-4
MSEEKNEDSSKILRYIITGIIIGYAAFIFSLGAPKVGVIKIDGVLDSATAEKINKMLRYSGDHDDVRAVVLEINSPGGGAVSSEDVYLNVLALKGKKPVVSSIDEIGASGAYFIASASDYIFSKPTSNVGSIGVRAIFPTSLPPDEETLTTGPLKRSGISRDDFIRDLEIAKQSFLKSVMSQRGHKLNLSEDELAKAGIYLGAEAKKLGLVDEIGSHTDASKKAASLAGLKRFRTIDINKKLNITLSNHPIFLVNESSMNKTNTAPIYNFIYLRPG